MGYTHYWRTRRGADLHPRQLIEDIGTLADASGLPLDRQLGRDGIWINGVGDDGHETLVWPPDHEEDQSWCSYWPDWRFDFCKTARKPYDVVVTASLIAVKDRMGPDVIIGSDGQVPNEWLDGLLLFRRTFPDRAKAGAAALVDILLDKENRDG